MAGVTRDVGDNFCLSLDFGSEKLGPDILWYNPPQKYELRCNGATGIKVYTKGQTDFWKRTYHKPEIVKDNGHLLHLVVKQTNSVIESSFELSPQNQFDQAGIMIRVDGDHWIKTGLEFVDNRYLMSCVVTNKWSDWSHEEWKDNRLALRVNKIDDDYVIDRKCYNGSGSEWKTVRIAHLDSGGNAVKIGLYCCSPTKEGMSVVFDKFSISAG
ncbi:uncharacterized protein [Acropora muricata]|uniref:regulation of enolase protein 1-like n=1 Tax=Acropora millepora TaxID=45264 RepID=UPI0010FC7152|nr:regulation of enolase protein 1-like [Acropora millepora]